MSQPAPTQTGWLPWELGLGLPSAVLKIDSSAPMFPLTDTHELSGKQQDPGLDALS